MSLVELSMPAKADYLLLARLALSGLARVTTIDAETLADLKLAITEACANAVRHAYPGDEGSIRISFELREDGLDITVEDAGRGFEAGRLPTWEPTTLDEDGMGLAIMRAVVDDIDIERGPEGRGTLLRLHKAL